MPRNQWSPLTSIRQGQEAEESANRAAMEGRSYRDMLAAREAAALMGAGDYLTGYEGVPGAVRPDYLKRLYASGDPDVAIKMESLLAAPYLMQREVQKAGQIEAAKKAADYAATTNAMRAWMEMRGRAPQSAGTVPATSSGPAAGWGEPAAVGAPAPASLMPQPSFSGLSGEEETFEFTPQGPKFGVKSISDLDRAVKVEGVRAEREKAGLERRKTDFDEQYKGQDIVIRKAAQGLATTKEKREAVQQAHDNVRKVGDEIVATQKAMQNRDIPWEEGQRTIEQLKQELNAFSQQRDELISRANIPAPQKAPASAAEAAAALPPPVTAPTPKAPARPAAVGAAGAPGFTEKERAALAVKEREEKTTAANKEITNARLGAQKIMKFKRHIGELFDLVTKQDIGHPAMEGVPGAVNVLSMGRSNAQVKKLSEEIINMFAEPGQSQMMNTIVERQMQGAIVPGLFTDPQLNKINAAILRSNVEHLQNFPSFLEMWQKAHMGTLDGAADAWIDYTDNNPLYTYNKDPRGKVKVEENSHVVPLKKWLQLRAAGGIKTIPSKEGNRIFIREDDGSWIEK